MSSSDSGDGGAGAGPVSSQESLQEKSGGQLQAGEGAEDAREGGEGLSDAWGGGWGVHHQVRAAWGREYGQATVIINSRPNEDNKNLALESDIAKGRVQKKKKH